MILFNILIPFAVMTLTQKVMMARPGGHGESDLLEKHPLYKEYLSNKGFIKGFWYSLPFFTLGAIPFLFRYTPIPTWLGLQRDYTWNELGFSFLGNNGALGIVERGGELFGPFGALSMVLSIGIPLGIAILYSTAYKQKTKNIILSRKQTKTLEAEFPSSLFQLGNRIGDGTPLEIAFSKTGGSTKGTSTEGFFRLVNENIARLGMNAERALFDPRRGAVISYPSQLVATSMRILTESAKKGLQVAARSMMAISDYVKNIKKINDRLNDLLADIVSDMKSNMTFLAPLLSGIIIGLAGMITTILGVLSANLLSGNTGGADSLLGAGGIQGILGIFDITQMIPTYWLQIIVGVYLVQIVFILTNTLVTVKDGRDELQTTAETANNLRRTIILYTIVALGAIIALNAIAAIALRNI
jgi:hypothetical protein